jgi:hypothetical protein
VTPEIGVTDETGAVSFRWALGLGSLNELTAMLEGGGTSVTATAFTQPAISPGGVVNAASFQPGLSPGAFASIFGVNLAAGSTASSCCPWPASLAGTQVRVNGTPVLLLLVSDRQINLLLPLELQPGLAEVVVTTPAGAPARASVSLDLVSPGLFFDAVSGCGAVVVAGSTQTTAQRPAARGEYLEIYGTGLGPVHSSQRGLQFLYLEIGGRGSNKVRIRVQ